MLGKVDKDELLFYITKKDVQQEAMEELGRHLTDEELYVARKGLDWGLMTGIDIVYDTILFEMIENKNPLL